MNEAEITRLLQVDQHAIKQVTELLQANVTFAFDDQTEEVVVSGSHLSRPMGEAVDLTRMPISELQGVDSRKAAHLLLLNAQRAQLGLPPAAEIVLRET